MQGLRKSSVFQGIYCKAFGKKAVYLSVRVYQLLKRCKRVRPLTEEAAQILDAMKSRACVDKNELKKELAIDTKIYNKALDFLLENLYITACAGKKLNASWYSYLYCTAEQFEKKIEGLHFNGDAKAELKKIVGKRMDEKSMKALLT